MTLYTRYFKRVFDLLLSFVGMVVLALPMLVIAVAVKLDSPGPVIFRQKRIGLHKKHFYILKFRTMRVDTPHDAPTHRLAQPQRWITKVGAFLRKTSLDELPQLFNIFCGHMSIVGPRPAIPREVEEYDARAMQRLLITPGLTCFWQIQPNRNSLSFEEWVDLDVKYIQERSFLTDWKIILATFGAVLGMNGE